jgi:uncharacterized protein
MFVPEPSSVMVERCIQTWKDVIVVSDFAIGEFGSAVSIRFRRGDLTLEQAQQALTSFDMWLASKARRNVIGYEDTALAARFVRRFELALRMPDALHLAVSARLDASLATLDRRQSAAAMSLGIKLAILC